MSPERRTHLLDYWAVLRRRRWVIYLGVAVVGLVALLASFLVTPQYRATATIQIKRQNPDIFTFRDLSRVDSSFAAYTDFYQTQYQILASDAVTRRAAERLNLESHPLFERRSTRNSLIGRLRALIPRAPATRELTAEDRATSWVRQHLQVAPERNSQLTRVSWVSSDPELAAGVANAVAEAYIQFNLESDFTTTDQATEFLVDQIGTLKQEILAIERRLQEYGEAKQIVTIDDSSNITLKALSDVAARRTAAQTDLAQKEARYRAVRDSPPEALAEVLHSDLIARLKQEYAGYEAEYSEKSRQFKDDWPGMQTLKSKMEQAGSRLELETGDIARKVVATAEAAYLAALNEVRNLDGLLTSQEQAAQRLKRDAFEYSTLQAEVERKRETLNALLQRQNEMALSTRLKDLDVTSSNIRIVDPARVPLAPFRPDKKINLAVGLLLGLGLGVGMAFFLDYLDNTVTTPAEVEKATGLPTLAIVPRHGATASPLSRVRRRPAVATEPVDLVAHVDGHAEASEAYRELRTALLLSNPGSPPLQLSCTSALPEEGKSATAVNLAVVLSQLGRRVLLVDADLRRPRLHRVFEAGNSRGISTYLSGLEADTTGLIVPSGVDNLDLLPSGPIPPNPSELLNSPVFSALGARLAEAGYDHVVYDSPPVLSVSDPVIVAAVVDAVVLVVRANRTPRESLRHAVEKLGQAGIRPVGAMINDLDLERHSYSHIGYYGRGYRYTSGEGGDSAALDDRRSRRHAGS